MSVHEPEYMRCVACGAVYDRAQPGGYFHKCPPVKSVADPKHGQDENGKDLSGPMAIEKRRNENIIVSTSGEVSVKLKGLGSLKASGPIPDEETEVI